MIRRKVIKVKFKNCDGEFEEVIAKKIESHADSTGEVEIKVILTDNSSFLLFDDRLDNLEIMD